MSETTSKSFNGKPKASVLAPSDTKRSRLRLAVKQVNRRRFLEASLAATILTAVRPAMAAGRKPRILLRSSWQTINIGDIAHSPGVLAILEKHLPEAEVILWASDVGRGVREMLLRRSPPVFPGVYRRFGQHQPLPDGRVVPQTHHHSS